jgi:hypothetical protein
VLGGDGAPNVRVILRLAIPRSESPKGETAMNLLIKTLVAVAACTAEGNVFTGQTMTFHSPGKEAQP